LNPKRHGSNKAMRISVQVKPNARKNEVQRLEEKRFFVTVTAPPVEGKANEKVVELLAEYFHLPKRRVTILKGATSKEKIVEIE
jgi:uncharacterized protein (TIGR00251 family)